MDPTSNRDDVSIFTLGECLPPQVEYSITTSSSKKHFSDTRRFATPSSPGNLCDTKSRVIDAESFLSFQILPCESEVIGKQWIALFDTRLCTSTMDELRRCLGLLLSYERTLQDTAVSRTGTVTRAIQPTLSTVRDVDYVLDSLMRSNLASPAGTSAPYVGDVTEYTMEKSVEAAKHLYEDSDFWRQAGTFSSTSWSLQLIVSVRICSIFIMLDMPEASLVVSSCIVRALLTSKRPYGQDENQLSQFATSLNVRGCQILQILAYSLECVHPELREGLSNTIRMLCSPGTLHVPHSSHQAWFLRFKAPDQKAQKKTKGKKKSAK